MKIFGIKIYERESTDPVAITYADRHQYIIAADAPFLFTGKPDSLDSPRISNLTITEDGHSLPFAHALHEDIAASGGGRYSHWGTPYAQKASVYFSSTDNTNPAINDRIYQFIYPLTPHPFFTALLLAICGLILAIKYRIWWRPPHFANMINNLRNTIFNLKEITGAVNFMKSALLMIVATIGLGLLLLQLSPSSGTHLNISLVLLILLAMFLVGVDNLSGMFRTHSCYVDSSSPSRRRRLRAIIVAAGMLSILALVYASCTGHIKKSRLLTADQEFHSIQVGNIKLIDWTSPADVSIKHVTGHMYVVKLDSVPFFIGSHDSPFYHQFSDMDMHVNGKTLTRPHSLHSDIEKLGEGRYSHWGNILSSDAYVYFSMSEDASPLAGIQTIEMHYRLLLHPLLIIILLVAGGIVMANSKAYRLTSTALKNRFNTENRRLAPITALFLFIAAIFIYPIVAAWSNPESTYYLIGGYLPWSDAAGWMYGAQKLLHTGELFEWTERRPLNPAIHAMISWVFGERLSWTLFTYTLIAAASAVFLGESLRRQYGVISSLTGVVLLAYFVDNYLPTTASETLGFILGVTGFAYMWHSISLKAPQLFCLGLAIFTAGMSARPGPMLILPMLFIWALFSKIDGKHISYRWGSFTALGICIGFLPTVIIAYLFGTNTNFPASNYVDTLYGLSLGGEPWTRAYADFPDISVSPDERARVILTATLNQILNQPVLLVRGAIEFLSNYFKYFLAYIDNFFVAKAVYVLLIVGTAVSLLRFRNPHNSFLIAGALGAVGSAPFIFWAYDAHRAYIVSVGFDAGLAAFGIYFLSKRSFPIKQEHDFSQGMKADILCKRQLYSSGIIMLIMVVGPIIAVNAYDHPRFSEVSGCPSSRTSAIFKIGRSSPYIHVVEPAREAFVPHVPADLISNVEGIHEYGLDDHLRKLQQGDMFIWGFNLLEPEVYSTYYVADKKLLPEDDAFYHVCGRVVYLEETGTHRVTYIESSSPIEPD